MYLNSSLAKPVPFMLVYHATLNFSKVTKCLQTFQLKNLHKHDYMIDFTFKLVGKGNGGLETIHLTMKKGK
jgi:hypothetical protein